MLWVLVFAGIAVAGLVMVIAYGVWLAHLTADVLSEVNEFARRGGELAELLGTIRVPSGESDPGAGSD